MREPSYYLVRLSTEALDPGQQSRRPPGEGALGESKAGHVYQDPLVPGTTVRIFTGAPIPNGTAAVVIQEDIERNADQIRFRVSPEIGENIRSQGHDIAKMQLLAKSGDRLDAYKISRLAACGVTNNSGV